MSGNFIALVLLPIILAVIMFTLGLGLTFEDFRSILKQPRTLLIGACCHFVLLPLVCFLMLKIAGITGALAVGFMILAACPTGAISNMLTYIARGDVALALSFTVVASLLTVFTLPLLVTWALAYFAGESKEVIVPTSLMMKQIFFMLALPVLAGMLVRARWSATTIRIEPIATKIAALLFVLIVIMAIVKNFGLLASNFTTLAPFSIALNFFMLAIGFFMAWLMRLNTKQAITLSIESSIQNAALALVIASSIMQDDSMALPGAVYGVLMYAGGMLFAMTMRRWTAKNRV